MFLKFILHMAILGISTSLSSRTPGILLNLLNYFFCKITFDVMGITYAENLINFKFLFLPFILLFGSHCFLLFGRDLLVWLAFLFPLHVHEFILFVFLFCFLEYFALCFLLCCCHYLLTVK